MQPPSASIADPASARTRLPEGSTGLIEERRMKRFLVAVIALGCMAFLGTTLAGNVFAEGSRSRGPSEYRVTSAESTTIHRRSELRAAYGLTPLIAFLGLLGILSAFAVSQTAPLLLYVSARRAHESEGR